MSLIDTGWTLSVGDGVAARTWMPGSKGQFRVEDHLRGLVRAHAEDSGVARLETRARGGDEVPAWRNIRKRHLPGAIGDRLGDHDPLIRVARFDLHPGHVHGPFERRNRRHYPPGRRSLGRLRPGGSGDWPPA
ncbi:MAG: hypothetical protein ABIS06_02305 [Vicinamibacterales bacterium]